MCGILGQINFTKELSHKEKNTFNKGLKKLDNRGPDASGVFAQPLFQLGHTRLSILDTSARANQPFVYKDQVITFNGEIYNFKTLRDQLEQKGYQFKTTSDTEVILYSYLEYGERCVDHFDGMWAFCISNIKTNTHFLSRDRIGEKPLVYYQNKNSFFFASELPALLELIPKQEKEPNWEALANFNTYNFRHIPAPHTAFKNTFKLEPGYNLIIKGANVQKTKYFKLTKKDLNKNNIETLDKTLQEAVEQTTVSDVPIGIFLSGGVDSSLVAAYLANTNISTYSLGFDRNDPELHRAKKIATKLNLKNKQIYFKEHENFKNIILAIQKQLVIYGEPLNLMQTIYSSILLDEMKKDHIKVAIGGNGADELFYGYDGVNNQKILTSIRHIYQFFNLHKLIKINAGPFKYLNKMPVTLKKELYQEKLNKKTYIKSKYKTFLYSEQFDEYAKEIKSQELIDVFNWLGLRIENEHSVTTMADLPGSEKGMEIRTPFLNKKILDYATSLPNIYKVKSSFNKKHNKHILKTLLAKKIGKQLAYFKKMGFGYGVDFGNLIIKHQKSFKHYISLSKQIRLFDYQQVKQLYQEHLLGKKNNQQQLIEILIICIWYEQQFMK